MSIHEDVLRGLGSRGLRKKRTPKERIADLEEMCALLYAAYRELANEIEPLVKKPLGRWMERKEVKKT